VLGILIVGHAWLAAHDDRLRMNSVWTAQQQVIDAANARERQSGLDLQKSISEIKTLKRSAKTPGQIVDGLQRYLKLPEPIRLEAAQPKNSGSGRRDSVLSRRASSQGLNEGAPSASVKTEVQTEAGATDNLGGSGENQLPDTPPPKLAASTTAGRSATIPIGDLRPLYDYVQGCRECEAKLTAANLIAADQQAKLGALARERDAAVATAKGGGFAQRLRRNAIWFAVGVAAGAATGFSTRRSK
jgi:hypothetical protein